MGSESQEAVDLEKPAPYEFKFDIAVAPEFKIELNGKNKIDYYEIAVDDKLIDQQVEMFQSRSGHYEQAEVFDPEQRNLLKVISVSWMRMEIHLRVVSPLREHH